MNLEYGLVENALHSLQEAMFYYHEGDEQENADKYKFSILLSAHCAELLLKEILRRNHPALLYENIDKVSSLADDNGQTVGYTSAIQRVQKLCGVDLHQYETYLSELGKVRNQIQHYKYSVNGKQHKLLMAKAFSAIEYLFCDILRLKFNDFQGIIDQQDIDFLHDDAVDFERKRKDIRAELEQGHIKLFALEYAPGKALDILCPHCGNQKVLIDVDKILCKMCGTEFEDYSSLHQADRDCITSSAVLREIGRRKASLEYIYDCPECENASLVKVHEGLWKCLVCGTEYADSCYCDECGKEMPNSPRFFKTAMSDTNTADFKQLCPECAKEAQRSDKYIGYEIS